MLENNLIETRPVAGFASESFVTKDTGSETPIPTNVGKNADAGGSKPELPFAEVLEQVATYQQNPQNAALAKSLTVTVETTNPDVELDELNDLEFVTAQPTFVAQVASDPVPTVAADIQQTVHLINDSQLDVTAHEADLPVVDSVLPSVTDVLPVPDEQPLDSIPVPADRAPVEVQVVSQLPSDGAAPIEPAVDSVLTVTNSGVSERVAVPQANIATRAVEGVVEGEVEGAVEVTQDPGRTDSIIQQQVNVPTEIPIPVQVANPVATEILAAVAPQAIGPNQVIEPAPVVRSNRGGPDTETESNTSADSIPETAEGELEPVPPTIEFATASDLELQLAVETEIEPVVSEANTQSNRQPSNQPTAVSQHDVFVTESPVRSVTESGARTDSANRVTQDLGRLTTQRVSETMIREVQIEGNSGSKQMTLHLHPEQLGKLTLQVGWESESIVARIVASEQATSDMLNRDKSWLMDTMQDNGFKFDSFDVSYGGSEYEQELNQNSNGSSFHDRGPDPENAETQTIVINEGQGSVINIIA